MRGALAGAFTAWLALIALQALATQGGSGRVREAFTDLNALIEAALDPTVPAIRDRRAGAAPPATARSTFVPPTTTRRLPVPGQDVAV